MKRLIGKLLIVMALSATYGVALSNNFIAGSKANPFTKKANLVCICSNGYEVICHTSCQICCR